MFSCAFHIIKTAFELVFCKISKFFTGSIDWNRLLTNRKCPVPKPKLYAWFDWSKIPSFPIRSIPDSSWPIKIWIFQILKAFDKLVFVLSHHFSSTPLNPSYNIIFFFFFCLFPSQSFKVFFYIIGTTLLLFFFLIIYQITS